MFQPEPRRAALGSVVVNVRHMTATTQVITQEMCRKTKASFIYVVNAVKVVKDSPVSDT